VTGAFPTGVVTFLFTDIEGSTKLWDRCPDAMRIALTAHDAIISDTIQRNDGAVFKTAGDAFCAAFLNPRQALTAAIEAQRALHARTWPPEVGEICVRMGVHSGECVLRDGDYFGPTVNRVARVSSVAYGRQILVSSVTAALLRDALDRGIALRALGPIRLKDLSQPERTFQVIAEGLRSNFPAIASLDACPNNLPFQISTFVGREQELETLSRLALQSRLLTIAGPGGIGKTRLALQLAANLLENFSEGAWFVDLTAVRDPDFIPQAIAERLNVPELPYEPIAVTLLSHLSDGHLLLLVDNAEHLIAGVARFMKMILAQCPAVMAITTSREPLHVVGEQVYRLGPLLEAPTDAQTSALSRHDSTRLFLERAHEAAPSLAFGDEERADVIALCKKLEGVPLAIELACARLSSMPLKQLTQRLQSILTLSSRDSTESSRHRTLRETIAWSYRLLSANEQTTLRVLSVFRGGCTADAIGAVAGAANGIEDAVDSLVDKSLLQLNDVGPEERYQLLDVVREFAYEQLQHASEERATARDHAAYYTQLVARFRAAHEGSEPYAALDGDSPNLRAALEWSFAHDAPRAVMLLEDLTPYWRLRGNVTEARSWIGRALDTAAVAEPDRASLLCLAASFATLQDELAESLRLAHEALTIYRTTGDRPGAARALFRVAEATHRQGQLEAAGALYREAIAEVTVFDDARTQMLCLGNLGMLARQRGDLQEASELLNDAIERAMRLHDERVCGEFTIAMGWVQIGLNDLAHSRKLFENALAQKTQARDRYGICCARHGVATVALREGSLSEALGEFQATLQSATDLQLKDYIARGFHGIAAIRALNGDAEFAQRLLGLADRLFRESGRELRDSIAYDIAVQSIAEAVPEPRRAILHEEGAHMRVADALDAVRAADERSTQHS
jgi:predicted ATPase/class 3 adenylate cyclase